MTLNGRAAKTPSEAHQPSGHRARKTAAFHGLSTKWPSERVGYARRLATRACAECWKAVGDVAAARERNTWLAGRSAEELAETEAWEARAAMPGLDGSDKAVEWGRRVRHQLLVAAHATLGLAEDDFAVRIENHARRIYSASWWIDQRDSDPVDLEELVTDAASNDTASSNGNPY